MTSFWASIVDFEQVNVSWVIYSFIYFPFLERRQKPDKKKKELQPVRDRSVWKKYLVNKAVLHPSKDHIRSLISVLRQMFLFFPWFKRCIKCYSNLASKPEVFFMIILLHKPINAILREFNVLCFTLVLQMLIRMELKTDDGERL